MSQAPSAFPLMFLDGVGLRRLARLFALFSDLSDLLYGERQRLKALRLSVRALQQLDEYASSPEHSELFRSAMRMQAWLAQEQVTVVSYFDAQYPLLLKHLADPPAFLFCQGNLSLLHEPQIAIVGSRKATAGGLENAYQFAAELSSRGFVVTSGFALGIDTQAHEGALTGVGGTVAVLGTGLDQTYPQRNAGLRDRVREQGLIVTEFPLETPPKRENFPQRNRIISGLSCGVLVVEADVRSGSLITARQALDQGREVFAIPGSIHNPLAKGCHVLIQQGAKLTMSADDILEEIQVLTRVTSVSLPQSSGPRTGTAQAHSESLSASEDQVLAALGYERCDVDALMEQTGLSISEILNAVCMLELKGVVQSVPGGYERL